MRRAGWLADYCPEACMLQAGPSGGSSNASADAVGAAATVFMDAVCGSVPCNLRSKTTLRRG